MQLRAYDKPTDESLQFRLFNDPLRGQVDLYSVDGNGNKQVLLLALDPERGVIRQYNAAKRLGLPCGEFGQIRDHN